MGQYIDIKQLFDCKTCFHLCDGQCDTWCDHGEAYRPAMSKFKVVDAEEVVRCKDCKESYIGRDGKLKCECLYPALSWVEPDNFCSYGERKMI